MINIKTYEDVAATVERVAKIVEREAQANHDAATILPPTLDAFRESGILTATVPPEHGGWGFGVHNGRPRDYWQIVRRIARADTSVGQSLQVHCNTVDFTCALGTQAQTADLCRRVVDGAITGAWGATRPGLDFGSVAPKGDGFVLNTKKAYATNAGFADIAMVMVAMDEAAGRGAGIQCVLVDCNQPGIQIDHEWWGASLAMRATASHKVIIEDVAVGPEALLGDVNGYLTEHLQIRSLSAFASNFLGTLEALTDQAREYAVKTKALEAPRVVRRMAALYRNIVALEGTMNKVAAAWNEGSKEVLLLSNLYRWAAGEALVEALDHVSVITGSSTLFADNPVGRRLMDALMYVRHENNDRLETTVGRGFLGLDADFNFSGLKVADGFAGTG